MGAERSTESLAESLSSLGSLGIEGESSTESLGLDPNALEDFRASPPTGSQILPMTSEHPEQQEEGGYAEQTPRDSTRDADGREQDERGKKLFHSVPAGEAAVVEDHDESHHDKGQISPEGERTCCDAYGIRSVRRASPKRVLARNLTSPCCGKQLPVVTCSAHPCDNRAPKQWHDWAGNGFHNICNASIIFIFTLRTSKLPVFGSLNSTSHVLSSL